jgi:hypothetical protein
MVGYETGNNGHYYLLILPIIACFSPLKNDRENIEHGGGGNGLDHVIVSSADVDR